jgi:hypothetical protein
VGVTLTRELKQAVEKAGEEAIGFADLQTRAAHAIVPEGAYRRMCARSAIDHSDRWL